MGKIDSERLYREADVSKLLGVKTSCLANWRSQGKGPPYSKIGRAIWYSGADVKAFIAAQRRVPSKHGEARQ